MKSTKPSRRRWAGTLLATVVLAAAPARAQIVECAGVRTQAGYKVLLDDLVIDAPASQTTMDRILFGIDANLQRLQADFPETLQLVRCERRRPSDESAFDRTLVEELDRRDVVLELWGAVASGQEQGVAFHEAFLRYALIPVRATELAQGAPKAMFRVHHRTAQGAPAAEVIQLFDQAIELQAYVAVGIGVNALGERKYDVAVPMLCRGQLLLDQVLAQSHRPDHEQLRAHAATLARDGVAKARADRSYQGALRLLSAAQALEPCSGGR